MDTDLAIMAALASCWGSTLYFYCLRHVFKNVIKKCSSYSSDNEDRSRMLVSVEMQSIQLLQR